MGSGNEAGFPFEPGTMADDHWSTKIQRLDARVFQGVLALLMCIVLVFPLGIPVGYEPFLLEVTTWIESLEPGDVIWLSQHYSVGSITDYGAIYTSLILHILLKSGELKEQGIDVNDDGIPDGLKLLCVPVSIDGIIQFEWQIQDRIWNYIPDNIVYGEDYVLFPMMVLSDALYDRYGDEGFASVYPEDYGLPKKLAETGNPIYAPRAYEDIPCLIGIVGPEQIDANIGEDATTSARIWARYGQDYIDHSPDKYTKYSQTGRRRPHAAAYPVQVWDSAAQAVAMPYYTAGLYAGFFNGIRNGGQYERWLLQYKFIKNDPALGPIPLNHGFGAWTLDTVNLAMMWTWLMMLVGNIGYFVERRVKGGR